MERDMKSSQLVQQEKKEEEEEKVSSTGHPVHHHHTIKRSSHKRSRYMKRKRSTRRRPSRMHLLSSLYQTLHDKLQAARVLLSPPFDQQGQDRLEPEDLRISIITTLLNHDPYAPLG
eukprot:c23491_g1_i3 orf=350-700(+)